MRVSLGMLLTAALLLVGCGGQGADAEKQKAASVEPKKVLPVVETLKVEPVEFVSTVRLTGESEADESVTVSAEMPGVLVTRAFKEGSEVTSGQRLARLDVRVDRARAGQLRANLRQSERDLQRTIELEEKGLATEADVERARLGVENNQYSLRQTVIGVGKSVIKAPISGVVDQVFMDRGEYANPGQPIATIVNYDKVVVRAGVPESRILFARVGQEVKVRVPALGVVRKGIIERVGVQADTKNRTFPVKIMVENADRVIRPGMRAMVEMAGERVNNALLVPRDVVIDTVEGKAVFVLQGDTATRRLVELGPDFKDYVVLTSGIKAGDQVISVGQHSLPRTSKVTVSKSTTCCREAVMGLKLGGGQDTKEEPEKKEEGKQ